VTTFKKKKAAALGHSAAAPILRILYSPECVEGEFCELRTNGVLRSSAIIQNQGVEKGPSQLRTFSSYAFSVYFCARVGA
jgi:hypothetical protein